MKRLLALLLALAMVFSLAACSGGATEPAQTDEPATDDYVADNSIMNIALAKNVDILDGIECNSATFLMIFEVFDTLVKLTADGGLEPCLATSWEQVDDYTWHFTLREGVQFSDGREFNAESAAYTLNWVATKDPAFKYKAKFASAWPISATADDTYELTVKTSAPCFETAALLSRIAMWPVGAVEDYENFVKSPVGTGPYVITNYSLGENIQLEANPNYWGEAPKIQKLNYDIITDSNARTLALQSGKYDFVVGLSYDDANAMQAGTMDTKGLELLQVASTGMQYLFFNGRSENPFIQNNDFRIAMTYAIDHEGILSQLLYGYCEGAHGVTTTTKALNNVYVSEGYPTRDIAKAQQMAADCGYNGEEIKLYYISGQFTNDLEITELIVSQLQEAGFNVKMQEIESASWSSIRPTSEYDIALNSCSGSFTGQPTDYVTQVLGNSAGWHWDDVDELIAKCYSEGTTEEQFGEYMVEALEKCWNYMPYMWAAENTFLYAVNPHLKGAEYLATGYIRLENAYFE